MEPSFQISYWEAQTFLKTYDVIVLGSGIVGLNAAVTLKAKNPKLKIGVVDRGTYPIGASTRNAGFSCFGSVSEILSDVESMGYDAALSLVEKRKRGLDRLFSLVNKSEIDYLHQGGNELFLASDDNRYDSCLEQMENLNKGLFEVFGGNPFIHSDARVQECGLNEVSHLIGLPYEGQLHPGKLVYQLRKKATDVGIELLNGVNVTAIEEGSKSVVLSSNNLNIECKQLIVSTNGFVKDLMPDLNVTPARNQVLLSKPLKSMTIRGCFHYNEGYVYFRDVGDRLLIGGARNIDSDMESTSEFGLTEKITSWLENFTRKHVLAEIDGFEYSWSGIMGVGTQKDPIVKAVSTRIAVAVRLGGMGVAIGSLVGQEVAELTAERV